MVSETNSPIADAAAKEFNVAVDEMVMKQLAQTMDLSSVLAKVGVKAASADAINTLPKDKSQGQGINA